MPSEEIQEPDQLGLFDEPEQKKEPVADAAGIPAHPSPAAEAPARSYSQDGKFNLPPDF